MERVSDYKLLERLVLPGISQVDCSGLVLVVGPNSAGKTQLLRDIRDTLDGEPRQHVVALEVIPGTPPPFDELLSHLEKEGLLGRTKTRALFPLSLWVGAGQGLGQVEEDDAKHWHKGFRIDPGVRNDFLKYFGRLLVAGLFLDRRLNALNQGSPFDHETQPPQSDLQALLVNDKAKELLTVETQATFGKAVWPDMMRGTILCLRVSEEGKVPSAEDRHSPKKMAKFRQIEDEGDGMRSYVAICVALLLGSRPVRLIDEPELCLHPPQAYNLGRFIAAHGGTEDTATLVATHSSNVLRGVIQGNPTKLQIIRLSRTGTAFQAHLVDSKMLREALTKPTMRAEAVLDGIFSQAVIVLEADADRAVYQTALETLGKEYRLDVHFTPVGGTGGVADTCRLYRTLRIPVAVIADLDMLADREKMQRVLEVLAPSEERGALLIKAEEIATALRRVPPSISPEEVRSRLGEQLKNEMRWAAGDDRVLMKELREVSNALDRMRGIKRDGVEGLVPPELKAQATSLLGELARRGLFLVPVGELEEWLKGRGIKASKSNNKWAWANEASSVVREAGPQDGDIWDFMRGIVRYLRVEGLSDVP